MIDEDLYQQATDELNSDKRRPHIWARACALASDDHDEARYLYTNLRVEELIAERDASEAGPDGDSSQTSSSVTDATLALEPLDLDDDIPESISAPSGIDQTRSSEEVLSLNTAQDESDEILETIERKSFAEKFEDSDEGSDQEDSDQSDYTDEHDELAFADEYLDETINLTSELDGTAVFELDKSDASEFDDDDRLLADHDVSAMSGEFPPFDDDELANGDTGVMAAANEDDELEALLGGIYQGSEPPPPVGPLAEGSTGEPMTLAFSDVTGAQAALDDPMDDSLEWLEGELSPDEEKRELQQYESQAPTDEIVDEAERLAQEFERQADELPGQRSDIVAFNDGTDDDVSSEVASEEQTSEEQTSEEQAPESGDTFDEEVERDIAESLRRKANGESLDTDDVDESDVDDSASHHEPVDLDEDGNHEEHLPAPATGDFDSSDLPAAAAMAAAGAAAASHATTHSVRELPIDLSDQQSGTRYTVFRRGDQAQAVKNGVSWSALFLTLPYLVYRHLFGTALVYAILWLIVMAGLLVSGLAWLDAGPAATTIIKVSTLGFALLALIGLLYLPFRHANQWREAKLEQRGFELVAWVRASSPGKAIAAARRAATLE